MKRTVWYQGIQQTNLIYSNDKAYPISRAVERWSRDMYQVPRLPQSFPRFLSVSASPRFNNPQHPGIRRQSAIARTDLAHRSNRHVGISTTVAVPARNCPRLR